MKPRDYGFLLTGLIVGAVACGAFSLAHRGSAPSATPPATVDASSPATSSAATQEPSVYQPGGNVYLAGDVHKEGVVEIRPNETLTVSQAIALDGGVAASADARNVKLMRRRADGTSDIIPVDLHVSDSGYAKDPAVQPGDLINVPDKEITR